MNKFQPQLFNCDCFEKMKEMKDGSVDLIVTDPPYGIGFKGKTSTTDWDSMSNEEYKEFLTKFLSKAKRILKDDGTIWLCCARQKVKTLWEVLDEVNLQCNMENWLTYVRSKGRSSSKKLKSQCEEVFHITKSNKYTWNTIEYLREVVAPYMKDGKPRGWVIDQNTGMRVRWSGVGNALFFSPPFFKNTFEKQIHSTQKPFLLWTELIMISSNVGEIVFDPFAGSASSGVSATVCDRQYIGCEIESEMFEKAKNWLENIDEEGAKSYIRSRLKF